MFSINIFNNTPYSAEIWGTEECPKHTVYIGHSKAGPLLQYTINGVGVYNGIEREDYENSVWYNLYSQGDFGKRYASGGTGQHTAKTHIRD